MRSLGSLPRRRGWTALEVMVALALLVTLLIVGVPRVSRYIDKARSREAIDNVDRMVAGSALYISTPMVDQNGLAIPCQFPQSAPQTPARPCCDHDGGGCVGVPAEWEGPTWRALNFQVTGEHRFTYRYESSGTLSEARFRASAMGDLDCDGASSLVARGGIGVSTKTSGTASQCSLRLAPAFEIVDRFE